MIDAPPPPMPPPTAPALPRGSGRAKAALVFGFVGVLLCFTILVPLLAIVFGLLGRKATGRSSSGVAGRGRANAGLILGVVGLALGILIISLGISNRGKTAITEIEVGMCVNVPQGNELNHLTKKSCNTPHDAEVVSTPTLDQPASAPWPSAAQFQTLAADACGADFLAYVGADQADRLEEHFIYPTQKGWEDSVERRIICYASDPAGKVSKTMRAG
jgi:hypothetical protein